MAEQSRLGVRYVLPLYSPLSSPSGNGARPLERRRWIASRSRCRSTSLAAHPDSSPTSTPSRAVFRGRSRDSNIDWGQDCCASEASPARSRSRPRIDVFGWHDYGKLGFPPHYRVLPMIPTQGWVAVSEHLYIMRDYKWLRGRDYERVGKSIRLYYIQ